MPQELDNCSIPWRVSRRLCRIHQIWRQARLVRGGTDFICAPFCLLLRQSWRSPNSDTGVPEGQLMVMVMVMLTLQRGLTTCEHGDDGATLRALHSLRYLLASVNDAKKSYDVFKDMLPLATTHVKSRARGFTRLSEGSVTLGAK